MPGDIGLNCQDLTDEQWMQISDYCIETRELITDSRKQCVLQAGPFRKMIKKKVYKSTHLVSKMLQLLSRSRKINQGVFKHNRRILKKNVSLVFLLLREIKKQNFFVF